MSELEELNSAFTPKPGGRLDAVSKMEEIPEAPESGQEDLGLPIISVKVAVPEWTGFSTITLSSANPYIVLLPQDRLRCRSLIIPNTNPIYITNSLNNAQNIAAYVVGGGTAIQQGGAYLAAGAGVPLDNRDLVYAVATTVSSITPVSVIIQRYTEQ